MVPTKFLVGGTVAVGSSATAVVVANQYGLFNINTSAEGNQGTETGTENTAEDTVVDGASGDPSSDPAQAPETTKPNHAEIKKWLTDNQSSTWAIKIKTASSQNPVDLDSVTNDGDLTGLKDYLEGKKEPLKSLVAIVNENTLTLENNSGSWTYSITHGNITAWVKENWGSNTTLAISNESATDLSSLQPEDLRNLFEHLFSIKTIFESLKTSAEAKSLLFIKDELKKWKHIKNALEEWLTSKSGNTSSLSLKEGDSVKQLSDLQDEDVKKLFENVKTHEKLFVTWKEETTTPKNSLEFKKEGGGWKMVASPTTIAIWVKNTSGSKVNLKLWENDSEKVLSTITQEEDLKKLFECLKNTENEALFKNLQDPKTLVFEKVNTEWKHIKKAIEEWLKSQEGGKGNLTIQIKKGEGETQQISSLDDDDLTGLLKHLKDQKSVYVKDTKETITLTRKQQNDPKTWEKAENK